MRSLLDRFGRIVSPGRRFIPEVDGLRFIAIALVVFYHVGESVRATGVATSPGPMPLNILGRMGYYGVDLFFALSGFVLSLPFARRHLAGGREVNLRAYYMRRLTRLEPPYLIVLLGDFAIRAAIAGHLGHWRNTAASSIYQHNIIFGTWSPVFGVGWSLEVEVQFYLLAPLLSWAFAIRSRLLRRSFLIVAIVTAARLCGSPHIDRLNLSVLGHLHEFIAGFVLADLYVASWKETPRHSYAWDIVSLIGWPLLVILGARRGGFVNSCLPLVVLVLYGAAFRGELTHRLLSLRWVTAIGGMCYTIYLLHFSIMDVVSGTLSHLFHPGSYTHMFVERLCVFVPPILLASCLFFVLVERPCMNPRWPSELGAWVSTNFSRKKPGPTLGP